MRIRKSMPNLINVCIDGTDEGDVSGRFFHGYDKNAEEFSNIVVFFRKTEQFFDEVHYPQAVFKTRRLVDESPIEKKRSAAEKKRVWENEEFSKERGAIATILVYVESRARASWQGEAVWVEKGITIFFQSTLELMIFIDGAVNT